MSREDIEVWSDDDVLTGEIMVCFLICLLAYKQYCLPSAPQCLGPGLHPDYCDPQKPPPWGWKANPPSIDPRTDLVRHEYGRRMGEVNVWFMKGDIALHGWTYKPLKGYEKGMLKMLKGKNWIPPKWLEQYADKGV